jgi:outer membrane protein, heavy metal efflux system
MRSVLLAVVLPFAFAATPVAQVLDADPPLPGEPLTGWEALEAPPVGGTVLDLDDAVELALTNHPRIHEMQAEVSMARGDLLDARSVPNPTWEVELVSIADDRTSVVPPNFEVGLELSEFVHAQLDANAASPDVEAARLRLEETRLRVAYETKAAYFDHQAALAAWSAALRSVDALAAGRDAQRAITAAGNAPMLDLARKEVAYEEARARAAELELEVVATRERLGQLVRTDPGTLAPPSIGALSIPADVEATAVSKSLALRAIDASIQAAERSRTAAQVEGFAPDVGIFLESERRHGQWDAVAGLELSVPFLSFGRGENVRAGAAVDRLVAERARIDLEVRSAARETALRLASAHRRARHYEEVLVPATQRVLDETLLHYNAMQVGLDVLLDAWRARTEVEVGLAETRREALTAQAAMDALVAGALVAGPGTTVSTSRSTSSEGGH